MNENKEKKNEEKKNEEKENEEKEKNVLNRGFLVGCLKKINTGLSDITVSILILVLILESIPNLESKRVYFRTQKQCEKGLY